MGPDRHGKDERELARNTPASFLPLAQDATEKKASTVALVCPVYLVYLVHLVGFPVQPTRQTR
jgi:hypothetical protein